MPGADRRTRHGVGRTLHLCGRGRLAGRRHDHSGPARRAGAPMPLRSARISASELLANGARDILDRGLRTCRLNPPGSVYLVGAGPGDPELITLKGRRVLEQRRLRPLRPPGQPDALLDLAPAAAERIYVGKKKSDHACSQDEICELMVIAHAAAGPTVVRLKGGDPFIFGRGGEEARSPGRGRHPVRSGPRHHHSAGHRRLLRESR